jgi:hypothetical protein
MKDGFEWFMSIAIGVLIAIFACGCSVLERPGEFDHLPAPKKSTNNLSHITPPMTFPQPSFKILKIRDVPHEIETANGVVVMKCYVLEIQEGAGTWRIVMDQNNRTIFQRFSSL